MVLFGTQCYVNVRRYANQADAKLPVPLDAAEQARLRGTSNVLNYLDRQAQQGRPLWKDKVVYGPWVWVTWGMDLAIAAVFAALMVKLAFGRPHCAKCQKWLRAGREGRLDSKIVAEAARVAGGSAAQAPADFRLWICPMPGHGGALDFAYRVPRATGADKVPRQTRIPLDAQQLARVQSLIQDQATEASDS